MEDDIAMHILYTTSLFTAYSLSELVFVCFSSWAFPTNASQRDMTPWIEVRSLIP